MVHNVFVWQKEKTICVRNNPPINLNLSLHAPISTIATPPPQFLNHNGNHVHLNHSHTSNHNHTPLTHISQISHTTPVTSVTPLSPNHSHVSFNHPAYMPTYGIRAATATPPTPKVVVGVAGAGGPANVTATVSGGRDASGSVSPGMPNGTLELSNVTTTNSPHELSTLV